MAEQELDTTAVTVGAVAAADAEKLLLQSVAWRKVGRQMERLQQVAVAVQRRVVPKPRPDERRAERDGRDRF